MYYVVPKKVPALSSTAFEHAVEEGQSRFDSKLNTLRVDSRIPSDGPLTFYRIDSISRMFNNCHSASSEWILPQRPLAANVLTSSCAPLAAPPRGTSSHGLLTA